MRVGNEGGSYAGGPEDLVEVEAYVSGTRFNHYFTKSFEEFQIRQNTNRTRFKTREQFDDRNRRRNDVGDDGMLRFAPAVRRALDLR